MSPNLPDGLKQQIPLPLVAHEADISGTKWNVWTTAGGITMQCCANSYGFFYSSVIIINVQSKTMSITASPSCYFDSSKSNEINCPG